MQFDQSRRRKSITLRGGTVAAWPLTARVAADAGGRLLQAAESKANPVDVTTPLKALLEHDPEKRAPVFEKDHAPTIN
jgi:hypothetical protein